MRKRGRPKSLNGKRCPECGLTETFKDGTRKAIGKTNGRQLWRCSRKQCRHQFIERGHRNPAHEAYAFSQFVNAPVKATERAKLFRELADKLKVSYRTISRWYRITWNRTRLSERLNFPRKLRNATKTAQWRVKDAALRTAYLNLNLEKEFYKILLNTKLVLALNANSDIEKEILFGMDTFELLKTYTIRMHVKSLKKITTLCDILNELHSTTNLNEAITETLTRMPRLELAYQEALSQFAYSKSDPIPYIRLKN